jgi:membrane-associated protease RseP (regulator of RpoE activity)
MEQFSTDEKRAFQRFVQGQQLWDRAMAQTMVGVALRDKAPLIVGIMGSGHMMDGFGVPQQLTALGVKETAVLVPWDEQLSCEDLAPGFAYAVFGLKTVATTEEDKPRLGVYLEPTEKGGMEVAKVVKHSVAEASSIAVGDRIVELAGSAVKNMGDVVTVVQRMVPGTWLPITVMRGDKRIEIVAKFPAKAQ